MTTAIKKPNQTPQIGYTAPPMELHNHKKWVLWNDDAGWPQAYTVKGKRADAFEEKDLAKLPAVALRLGEMPNHGVAYFLGIWDPYVVIHLKDCRSPKSGKIAEWARPLLKEFLTYSEINDTGTGIKLWTEATLPNQHPGKRFKFGEGTVEITGGSCYVAVTGRPVDLKTGKTIAIPRHCDAAPSHLAVKKWWDHFTALEGESPGEFIDLPGSNRSDEGYCSGIDMPFV